MADSVAMISDMVAVLDALPKTPQGDAKVEDPTALAVKFVGIVAPLYQADYDEVASQRDTAVSMEEQLNNELLGLRAEVDQLRAICATVVGALNGGDISSAQAALSVI